MSPQDSSPAQARHSAKSPENRPHPNKGRVKLAVAVRARRDRPPWSRRSFLTVGAAMLCGGALLGATDLKPDMSMAQRQGKPVRPPTALADDLAFQQACIRCGLCGTVCENGCIRFYGVAEGEHGAFTPFVDVRRRSCTLCMRCTNICPSGALTPVVDDLKIITKTVNMGVAVVDPDRCLSYLGRICGYCHDACPLPAVAIRLIPPARPVVLEEGCVGCGRCVEFCPAVPTAIDIAPQGGIKVAKADLEPNAQRAGGGA